MDYEKKYNEALKWMRELYPGLHGATKEDAEHYFPELREKPLTPFQQCLNCILRGVYYAEVPDKKVNEFIVNVVRTRTDELIKLAKKHEYTNCQLNKSKDEEIRQQLLWLCNEWEHNPERRTIPADIGNIKQIRRYLEKQKEQKPALKQTLDAYKISDERATAKMEGRIEGRQDVINNPEEYGLQKPAEWGEEDERILYNVIAYVGYAAGERGVKDDDFKEANEWLRNLRSHPSWKPSEEQMNCLCAAVDAAIRKHNESVSGYKPARVLKSLYEQLQRLM